MDSHLRSLLRRYRGGEKDLGELILNQLIRIEEPAPISRNTLPEPPKSLEDLIDILIEEITPLGVLNEWEDDHVVSGQVSFAVKNKILKYNMGYCGAEALASFSFGESPKAYAIAVKELRRSVLQDFDMSARYQGEKDDYADSEINEKLIKDLRSKNWSINLSLTRGTSRWEQTNALKTYGLTAYENALGPIQRYWYQPLNPGPEPGWKWMSAQGITIYGGNETGSDWYYSNAESCARWRIKERIPTNAKSLPLELRDNCSGCTVASIEF